MRVNGKRIRGKAAVGHGLDETVHLELFRDIAEPGKENDQDVFRLRIAVCHRRHGARTRQECDAAGPRQRQPAERSAAKALEPMRQHPARQKSMPQCHATAWRP